MSSTDPEALIPSATAVGEGGRVNQRVRTRHAIVVAGRALLESGHTPTVAEAADAALVSRATAYRYFASQADLLISCLMANGWPTAPELFARPDVPQDPEGRVAYVHDFFFDYIHEREAVFRLFVSRQLIVSLDGGSEDRTLRPGFRVGLLEKALEPIADELGERRLRRLINALGVLIGTEALIASRDSLHLDYDTARADNRWACRQLVRAAQAESVADSTTAAKTRPQKTRPASR